jgi:hypothetical protein
MKTPRLAKAGMSSQAALIVWPLLVWLENHPMDPSKTASAVNSAISSGLRKGWGEVGSVLVMKTGPGW